MTIPDVGEALAPPPLPWWGRLWRVGVCLVVSAVIFGFTLYDLEALGLADQPRYEVPLAVDVFVLGPVLFVGLWWHRRFPLWLSLLVAALSGVSTMTAGPASLLLMSVATRRRWAHIVPMALATVLAQFVYERVYPAAGGSLPWWVSALVYCAFTAAVIAWGMYIGARRELVAQWRWRAETAEAEQVRQVAGAQQAERDRIAREMHDVLAHRLSQVSLHAGVLSYRSDLTPEQVRAEAETIRAASTSALEDLRGVLGILRNTAGPDAADPVAAPQPTLADLATLVAESRADGTAVALVDERPAGARVPETTGRHAYRMTQEALTNARKHAPGTAVEVRVGGRPGAELVLTVTNGPGRGHSLDARGAGLGLVGLRERATIVGGSAQAGPTPDGGWRVEVRLPWAATEEDS